jgi:hypothetical protein
MMSSEHSQAGQEKIKRHAATVRMDDNDKDGLRMMKDEHPLYTESVIIRAALQALLVYSEEVRTSIVLASLNEKDVRVAMRRAGIRVPEASDPATGGEYAV